MVGSATVPKLIYDPIREGERYIYCYIESIDINRASWSHERYRDGYIYEPIENRSNLYIVIYVESIDLCILIEPPGPMRGIGMDIFSTP